MMLWIRGAIFTLVAPVVVAGWVPHWIDPDRQLQGGLWTAGWLAVVAGAAIYLLCLARFLSAGGTPAIYFTRPLRFLIGEEPRGLVERGLYRRSRNPMYLGVVLVVAGQAILFASVPIAVYGAMVWLFFHLVVVLIEEPHLRETRGASYDAYVGRVPRWLGRPRG